MRRALDVFFEPNNARHGKNLAWRAQNFVRVFNAFSYVVHKQGDGPLDTAYVQGLVTRIKNKHAGAAQVFERLEF